jgi:16S rRNA (uracil1498-N3)-methyltransferase
VTQLQRLVIAPTQCTANTVTLTPEQQHYLVRVLRLAGGDRFIAICDQKWWLAQLQSSPAEAKLLEPVIIQTELAQPITLLAALPKGSGFDEVVRTTTELGVATIIPLLTARTILNPSTSKLERWRRIAAEAAEQSCRQRVPEIFAPITFKNALALVQTEGFNQQRHLICVTEPGGINLWQALSNLSQLGILIMVGPEGGWTPEEQTAAVSQGFTAVSLGRRVLRAITASMATVAVAATQIEIAPEINPEIKID